MRYLAQSGWNTVGLEAVARFLAGEALPKKSVVVSFDDGYFDNWHYAAPILQAFDLKAVLFLASGWIGQGSVRKSGDTPNHRACMKAISEGDLSCMMNWEEVRTAQQLGMFEFHSHTHTHTRWDKKYAASAQKITALRDDLYASKATFCKELGEISEHLCWPQGYFDDEYVHTANALGFHYLYTTQLGTTLPHSAPCYLPRIVVKEKSAHWLKQRLFLYSNPTLSAWYARLKGSGK